MALTTGAQTSRSRKARIHFTVSLTDDAGLNTTAAVTVRYEPCEGDLNRDDQIAPPIQWVALELADAAIALRLAASGGWDANADMNRDDCITSPRRAHDPAGGGWGDIIMTEQTLRKSMKRIEFHNREKETKEIMAILDSEPSLITFVYGPINSGKTTLITHLIEELPDEYVVFYVNLRGKFISNYDDFVRALFKLDREKKEYKEILKAISEVSLKSLKFTGIPVTEGLMDLFFREKTYEDVFEFLEDYFTEIAENKIPVLIVDELQKIGDVRINTHLVYELFNLFVRLTKELHLCHVFAVTSDSLFVERVYSEAMLSGRCDYLLVDDFDENATAAFLEEHGFTDDEKRVAWECCGGKPVCLLELIRADDLERKIAKLLRLRTGELKTFLKTLNELGGKITVNDERHEINYELIIDVLKMFLDEEEIDMWSIDEISKRYLVKNNILFIDPDMGIIKPQSRLDLLAIREVMGDT